MNELRILASAYACQPGLGSEAGIGWNLARQIASRHHLWLVTRRNNVAAIERHALELGLANLRVVGFDLPPWARFWKRGGRLAMPYYYLWQRALAAPARRLDRRVGFDLVHHLTFASGWIPSGLATLGRPFVLGPVGQHPRIPSDFLRRGALGARLAEPLKALVRRALLEHDPAVRRTLAAADCILSLGSEFGQRVPAEHRSRVVPLLAAGVDPPELAPGRFARARALRILYAGRLVDLKGVRLALEAFAQLVRGGASATFELVGAGPLRRGLERRARELGLNRLVRLTGALPHAETLARMRRSDVFLFPSFEGGGMVVLEAMAAGAAVVCLDRGGPAEMVAADRGVRVPVSTFGETACALARALSHLATHEPLRADLARRAHDWAARHATWDAKGEVIERVYREVLRRRDGSRGLAEAA